MIHRLETIDAPFGEERTTIEVHVQPIPGVPDEQAVLHRGRLIGRCPKGLHKVYPSLFQEKVRRWVRGDQ